ncbi:MAG: hypothetical protein DYG99_04450 [Bacteroidetes bacterium CHB5]|nr:hypothetical protein [Bacteroidetes bacterium CHB5]
MIKKQYNPIIGDTLEIITEGMNTGQAHHLIEAFIPKGCSCTSRYFIFHSQKNLPCWRGRLYMLNGNKKLAQTKMQSFRAEKGKIHRSAGNNYCLTKHNEVSTQCVKKPGNITHRSGIFFS